MAYASMLGGMIFLFGTSTNLVVSEAMTRIGMPPLGFAELTPAGLPAAALAVLLIVAGNRVLLPTRAERGEDPPLDHREFATEAAIPRGSRLIGRSVGDIGSSLDFEINDAVFFYGFFLDDLITFIGIAVAVYFFVVLPYTRITERMRRGESEEGATTKTCPECITTIPLEARRCPACTTHLPGRWSRAFAGQRTSTPFLPHDRSRLSVI